MSSFPENINLLEASRNAAERAGIDAGLINDRLDGAHRTLTDGQGPFDLWAAINEQIGIEQDPNLRRELVEFRTIFEEELLKSVLAQVEQAFAKSAQDGWQALLTSLSEAVTRFRATFSMRLLASRFPVRTADEPVLKRLQEFVRLMFQSRWPEAYDGFHYLANLDFLSTKVRARLLVILGQIQLFHFRKGAAAKELIEAAEQLAPTDFRVLSGVGDYWLTEKDGGERDPEKARTYFERAVNVAPQKPSGYAGLGEYFEFEKKDLELAAHWYRKAMDAAPGDSLGHGKLLRLLGRAEFFATREPDLQPLAEQIIALAQEEDYQTYVDMGNIYEQNLQFDKAQVWYEKAISLDESRPSGHVAMAQLFQKQNLNEKAAEVYHKVIKLAPESYEGYVGLALLAELNEAWSEALDWYQRTPQHVKELAGLFQARVGEMHAKLGNNDEAEKIELTLLKADKTNETARIVLQSIADDYYQKHDNRLRARQLYDKILETVGDSYATDYHNRLGNLHYYYSEFKEAADKYREAIKRNPDNAVFHRNLALAHRELKDYELAEKELDAAFGIDNAKSLYDKEMSIVRNDEGNVYYALGDYAAAIKSYEKAVRHDSTNDVIYSNLGGAWKKLKDTDNRLEAIDNALTAYLQAQKNSGPEKYVAEIKELQSKKEFTSRYGEKAIDWNHMVIPIGVEVANDLVPIVKGQTSNSLSLEIATGVLNLRTRILEQFGVRIPSIKFIGNESGFSDGLYVFSLGEVPVASGTIAPKQRYCPGKKAELVRLDIEAVESANPVTQASGFLIEHEHWKTAEEAGLELWTAADYILRHLESVLHRNLIEFVGHQEIEEALEKEGRPDLKDLRDTPAKLTALATVCRALLAERVPIAPFADVCDAFAEIYSETVNPQTIVENIRILPAFIPKLPGNDYRYSILALEPGFETEIRNSISRHGACPVLAMDPERCQSALMAFREQATSERNLVVVVEDAELRPFVRLLIELEFPDIPVLARRELRADLNLERVGVVDLQAGPVESVDVRQVAPPGDQSELVSIEPEQPGEPKITVFLNPSLMEETIVSDEHSHGEMFAAMQEEIFFELGILVPQVRLEEDKTLDPNEFRLNINGREYSEKSGLAADEFLVSVSADTLKTIGTVGEKKINPATGTECAVLKASKGLREIYQTVGLTTWSPIGFVVLSLTSEIRKRAAEFQTEDVTRYIFDSQRETFPALVNATLERFSVKQITALLRHLLAEEISIRDMRRILEGLLAVIGTTDVNLNRYIVFWPQSQYLFPDVVTPGIPDLTMTEYCDAVRTSLRAYISYKYSRGANTLPVYLIDRDVEERIANVVLPLTPAEKVSFLEGVRNEVEGSSTSQQPVMLTTMDIRRIIRQLIKPEYPALAVLSYQELSPTMNIQPISRRISWSRSPETVSG